MEEEENKKEEDNKEEEEHDEALELNRFISSSSERCWFSPRPPGC